MRNKFFLLILFLLLLGSVRVNADDIWYKRDSILNALDTLEGKDKLRAHLELCKLTYTDEFADTLRIDLDELIKEAHKQHDASIEALGMTNMLSFFFNYGRYNEILERADSYLDFLLRHEEWDLYYASYESKIQSLLYLEQYNRVITEATRLYEQTKKRNEPIYIGMVASIMGVVYHNTGRTAEAEIYFKEALPLLPDFEILPFDAYSGLCQVLSDQGKYEEAIKYLEEYGRRIDEYSFKNATLMYTYYMTSARIYIEGGIDFDKGEYFCDLAEQQLPGMKGALVNVYCYKALVLEHRHQYAEALDFCRKSEACIDPGSLALLNDILKTKLRLLHKNNTFGDAYPLVEQVLNRTDSLRDLTFNMQLDELRTNYDVDKLTAEKEIHRQRWIIGIVASSLLLVALLIYILYSRRLKQRNLSLYRQIKELSRKEKAVESCFLSKPVETLTKEMQLFRRLNECMKAEKLFTDAELNRKKLADHLGTNESYLATAIRQGSGETFSDYVSNLRLQHALEMLNNHPEMTFEAIAIDSGHGSYSQFFRSFSKKYGISPSEYRRLSKAKM